MNEQATWKAVTVDEVEFRVLGIPAPQGSKTVIRGVAVEGSSKTGRAKLKSWRADVTEAAAAIRETRDGPLDGALAMSIEFRLPMPASRPQKIQKLRRVPHTVKPDLSKLTRSTEDAMVVAGLIKDDARISMAWTSKIEVAGGEWTGAEIRVWERRP